MEKAELAKVKRDELELGLYANASNIGQAQSSNRPTKTDSFVLTHKWSNGKNNCKRQNNVDLDSRQTVFSNRNTDFEVGAI